ncbi:MAG: NAD(P)H-hydrate dehydratase [Paracoccaceae bacterium]
MTELLTAAQMRAIEQAAIASGEVTGLELMERAGRGVVEAIFEEWPELKAGSFRAVVLCGPGNNGGDGFVVARLLKDWGWEVEVFLYGDPEKLPADARVSYERWRERGEVRSLSEFDAGSVSPLGTGDPVGCWIIDALFGTGLTRPLEGDAAKAASALSALGLGARPAVVAVDIPSGVCADSGRFLGAAMPAEQTVTFHLPKLGHYLSDGGQGVSTIALKSIGLKARPAHPIRSTVLIPGTPNIYGAMLAKEWDARGQIARHKYSHGHALILSGPPGHTGAARLAARGALRIGAGLVTIAAEPEAIAEHAAQLNAIMLREVGDGDGLRTILSDKRINALCLGPGLGLDGRAAGLVAAALGWHLPEGLPLIEATDAQVSAWFRKHGHRPACVLDADALTLLSRDPALFGMLHDGCVLTPHAGEFARLFPDIAEKLAAPATKGPAYSKVDATREAAKRAGCVVLYKGPDTVIADPEGRCVINSAHYDRAAPWLATAGSGDVLAGFIAGLLARGFGPMQAAETAAWLHVECALTFGPGLIAEDLPEQLPAVFRKLGV